MAITPVVLTKVDLKNLNNNLLDCEAICQDLDRAERAGVPNIQFLRDACHQCRDQTIALKKEYFPGDK